MLDVRAVIQRVQVPDQAQPRDRPPADVFDQPIVGASLRRNHHGAARELAIVECEEQAWAPVGLALTLDRQRKRPPVESRQFVKDSDEIAELSVATESARAYRRDVSRKSDAE